MKLRQMSWKVWLGLGVSLLCLLLAFHNVQLNELGYRLQQVSLPYLLGGLFLFVVYSMIVARRWQLLLTSVRRPSLIDSLSHTLIGRLVNNLFPLRAGEVAKALLLGQKLRASKSAVFATIFVDRLLDILSLLLFVIVLTLVTDLPAAVKQSAAFFGATALAALIVLGFLSRNGGGVERLFQRLPAFIPKRLQETTLRLLISFISGVQTLQTFRLLLAAAFYSVLAWVLVALSAWFFLESVNLHLNWYVPLFLVVVTNLGGAIPASPGSMGVFHVLIVYSLSLWSVGKEPALTMAIVYHESTYLLVTIVGLLFLWREGYSWTQVQQLQNPQVTQRP